MTNKNISINDDTDDSLLAELLQAGNKQAFHQLYIRYHKMLYMLAIRYLKNETMAEDAVQQIFVRLWKLHKDVVVSISPKNYLYTLLKNHVLNVIRDQNTAIRHNYEIAQMTQKYDNSLIKKIEDKELIAALYTAINLLPIQKRKICLLKMQDNLSNEEIADKMQISINTVKSHYTQSIKTLRTYMQRLTLITLSINLL